MTIHKMKLDEALERASRRRSFPLPVERRLLRMRAGLTQAEIAAAIGASPASISRYESGKREPSAAARERYCQVLDRLAREPIAEPTR